MKESVNTNYHLVVERVEKNDNKRKGKLYFYRSIAGIETDKNLSNSYYFIALYRYMHEYLNIILYLDYI